MSPGIELNTGKSNDLCILKNFWKHDISLAGCFALWIENTLLLLPHLIQFYFYFFHRLFFHKLHWRTSENQMYIFLVNTRTSTAFYYYVKKMIVLLIFFTLFYSKRSNFYYYICVEMAHTAGYVRAHITNRKNVKKQKKYVKKTICEICVFVHLKKADRLTNAFSFIRISN